MIGTFNIGTNSILRLHVRIRKSMTRIGCDFLKYRSEIDGLRALAVVPVILFHAGFSTVSGGFVGVDVFFVISGYLITTILVSELGENNFSLVRFYERRARRILPALFFVMLATIPFSWMLLTPYELGSYSKSMSAVSLFVSNFFFWRDGGYFETATELKPLIHTWSLAVEEQYYILFPVFLLLLWKYGVKIIIWSIIFIAVLSLITAQIGSASSPVPNFFLLPSRAWELSLGAMAAFYLIYKDNRNVNANIRQILSLCGFAAILTSIFVFSNATPFPSVYTLLPTAGAVFIILFSDKDTYVGAILGSKLPVFIGSISYSLYLWHQPVLAFAKVGKPIIGGISELWLLVLIFFLSVLTWKYIETPFRNRNVFGKRVVFIFSFSGTAFFALFGFLSFYAISNVNIESLMARELTTGVAVYASNMDERSFVKSRIEAETMVPKTIVLGSSRIMQVGSASVGRDLLNLGVSGSSVEDDVAIWKLVSGKFGPDLVLIGADPWLFNAQSGQQRWRTLEPEYRAMLVDLGVPVQQDAMIERPGLKVEDNVFAEFYRQISHVKILADNDLPDHMDKIRRDGRRVYNLTYANKSNVEVENGATAYATYAMSPYEYSADAEDVFKRLITAISKDHKVALVLSPYHPKLYGFMIAQDKKLVEIEAKFKALGASLGVPVIGSYDPGLVGCSADEFYDGMHPKGICMDKIIGLLR